ncbi:MAG: 23S rRNA (pseudouridine(1915)-N(3))-methyltransferase RlmH [Clostridia bacterium]|nr:23S rRNA (pseudouridine(1915)-N(3))-methyltransferase RlmH [Clostridia bacterium]
MLTVKMITVGTLKETYWRDALAEYKKRLSVFCHIEEINLKEGRLPDRPSESEIAAALESEAQMMLPHLTPRNYKIALCVEGKQFSSEQLAQKLQNAMQSAGEIVLVIGSSHGLSERVKAACDLRLSVSALTFPHQMMRVMLLEILYRCMSILKGTQYHK